MRVVAGDLKGRSLKAPEGKDVRPTSDRARESLFNVLLNGMGFTIKGARTLDMFAGTGALGLEALSRGAGHATFLEINRSILKSVSENVETLAVADRAKLICIDATIFRPLTGEKYDLVFIDPPYGKGLTDRALITVATNRLLDADGIIVTETGKVEDLTLPNGFQIIDQRVYGAAKLSFLQSGGDGSDN